MKKLLYVLAKKFIKKHENKFSKLCSRCNSNYRRKFSSGMFGHYCEECEKKYRGGYRRRPEVKEKTKIANQKYYKKKRDKNGT